MAMDIKSEAGLGLDLPQSAKTSGDTPKKNKSSKGSKKFVSLLVIIILLVIAAFLVNQYTSINLFGSSSSKISLSYSQDSYYAVFLTNGQVYFGKVTRTGDKVTILEDIYYLQVSNPLQQVPPPGTEQQPQLTLVKLGNELHGPKDYMKLNNDHVIFVEELKDDGRVVKAILEYKVSGQQAVGE